MYSKSDKIALSILYAFLIFLLITFIFMFSKTTKSLTFEYDSSSEIEVLVLDKYEKNPYLNKKEYYVLAETTDKKNLLLEMKLSKNEFDKTKKNQVLKVKRDLYFSKDRRNSKFEYSLLAILREEKKEEKYE